MTDFNRLFLYAFTVFLSSALLMVLELSAGRLLAPYIGVSIYTWTSIIGVILAGLSLGNWLGGVWADKGAAEYISGLVLAMAGITSLLVLLLLTLIAPLLQAANLSLLSASFLYVLLMFFIPAVLIGIVTPLLTTLSLAINRRTGHVIGMMHALSALGSIIGTFATGYWLVQYLGTHMVISLTAAMLLLMSIPFLYVSSLKSLVAMLVASLALAGFTYSQNGFLSPCDKESQYFCIRVVNANQDVPYGKANAMVLDYLLHGINHASEPNMLVSPYVHAMDELLHHHMQERYTQGRYFFAGGGSYTHPRALRSQAPEANIVIAEIDPMVTRMAKERMFFLPQQFTILHRDARMALQSFGGQHFDAIIGDVFHDVALPYHLTTREYTAMIKKRMTADGIYVLNVVDAYPDPHLVKSIYKTLRSEFSHVHIWLIELPSRATRMTYVLSATHRDFPDSIDSQHGFERRWQKVTDNIIHADTPLEALPLLTDNFVPVDRLVSRLITSVLGR